MNLSTLRRRALENSLDVEHILRAAKWQVPGLSAELTQLATDLKWSMVTHLPDGTHVAPLAQWAKVASVYADEGLAGLQQIAHDPASARYVMSLLEELNSSEAIGGLLEMFADVLAHPARDPVRAHGLVGTINLLSSFKTSPTMSAAQRSVTATFLNEQLGLARSNAERAGVMCAMRGAGDSTSLPALAAAEEPDPPFTSVLAAAIRAIRKRQRAVT